ncbi:MAG: deoxynucleoside kinase [Ardenticatenaceae bacterium]|nr:deoxynucleoside kinase [Ardenticatenaceae bacterium]
MNNSHYFITIAGNIGVGKSTLVELLSKKLGWDPVYEAVAENPYLIDFYQDMDRWSFHSQIFFLSRRLKQHYQLLQRNNSIIQDRSVYEDAQIFAQNLYLQGAMSERDWKTYQDIYETTVTLLKPPHLVVYLQASLETLERQIANRGRDFEQSITSEYLEQLNDLYEKWISSFSLSPVLTINTNNLNYVAYDEHLELIWEKIEHRLRGKDFLQLK